jgi:hypothetical protein
MAAMSTRPWISSASAEQKTGMPCAKLVVPSMGSKIQQYSLVPDMASGRPPSSSASTACVGNRCASTVRHICSTSMSTSVTRSIAPFMSIRKW